MKITADTIITKEIIDNIQLWDIIPNVFNKPSIITEITFKGVSPVDGKAYIGFYQTWGKNNNSEISGSLREGEKPVVMFNN